MGHGVTTWRGSMSSNTLNPIKARKDTLELLGEVLQGIPHAYQQEDFLPTAQVIRMLEAGDVKSSMGDLERYCAAMQECMAQGCPPIPPRRFRAPSKRLL